MASLSVCIHDLLVLRGNTAPIYQLFQWHVSSLPAAAVLCTSPHGKHMHRQFDFGKWPVAMAIWWDIWPKATSNNNSEGQAHFN